MDAKIQEKLRKAATEAAELATDESGTRTLTVRDILADLAKAEGLPATGKAVLEKILGAESFEDKTTLTLTIEMYTDPWQLKPTSTEVTPAGLPSAGQGSFASNEAIVLKAKELGAKIEAAIEELKKDVAGKSEAFPTAVREAIEKAGPATAKLEQIKSILKIDEDLKDYDLRWKVSELVGMLSQFAQVESIVDDVSKADPKAVKKAAKPQAVWPANMAAAKYDREHGVFKRDDLTWGHDDATAPR